MDDELSLIFGALADPTRRAIVARLRSGAATVNELAEPFQLSLPAISKHLKVLERAGLVTRSRIGQTRPCHLAPGVLALAAQWIDDPREPAQRRLDSLDAYLTGLQEPAASSPTSNGADDQ